MAAGSSACSRGDIQSVVVANVAQIASHRRMAVGQGEAGSRVIEYARGPGGDWVARCALCCRRRKSGRDVIWYCAADRYGAREGCLMAAITIRRIEREIVTHVAGSAGRRRRGHMRSGQRKARRAVVESCRVPTYRRVASGAVRCRERVSGRRVWGSIGLLPGRQMATGIATIGRCNGQTVVVIDMAQTAGHVSMPIRQRKAGRCMVKDSRGPGGNRVASSACRGRGRETGCHVVRHRSADGCGALKCCLVAAVTIRRI
jgi:hypothetical protein